MDLKSRCHSGLSSVANSSSSSVSFFFTTIWKSSDTTSAARTSLRIRRINNLLLVSGAAKCFLRSPQCLPNHQLRSSRSKQILQKPYRQCPKTSARQKRVHDQAQCLGHSILRYLGTAMDGTCKTQLAYNMISRVSLVNHQPRDSGRFLSMTAITSWSTDWNPNTFSSNPTLVTENVAYQFFTSGKPHVKHINFKKHFRSMCLSWPRFHWTHSAHITDDSPQLT